jgi:CHASE2 domain-containing sensor protein
VIADRSSLTTRQRLDPLFKKTTYALCAPLVTLGLVFLWNLTPLSQRLEYLSVNLRFLARAPFDPPADPRLVFVGIDQPTLDHLGAWPWPRNVEGKFLDYIAQSGMNPDVVAFDVLLTEDFDKFHYLQLKSGKDVTKSWPIPPGSCPASSPARAA